MQSVRTTKAWFHDRCNRVDSDACRGSNVTTRVRNTVRAPARSSARNRRETLAGEATLPDACDGIVLGACGWHRQGACGLHRQNLTDLVNRSERDPRDIRDSVGAQLGRQRSCIARQTRVGSTSRRRVGSTTWTSVECNAEAGPSYRSCTASPQRRRGVTVPSLIETICEL